MSETLIHNMTLIAHDGLNGHGGVGEGMGPSEGEHMDAHRPAQLDERLSARGEDAQPLGVLPAEVAAREPLAVDLDRRGTREPRGSAP